MASLILIVTIVIVLIYKFYKFAIYKPPNFPPGPFRIPLYGSYWRALFTKQKLVHLIFDEIAREYKSSTFSLYIGPFLSIVVTDYDDVKEIINRKEFDGRVDVFVSRIRAFNKRLGVFFTDGPFWHEQRRFTLRYLRDFGFGRRHSNLESVVEQEIKEIDDILRYGPKPGDEEIIKGDLVRMPDLFYAGFVNAHLTVFASEQYPRHQYKQLRQVARAGLRFLRSALPTGGFLSLTPWLRFFAPNKTGYRDLVESNEILVNYIQGIINKHKETTEEEPDRSFIDLYLNKLMDLTKNGDSGTFSDEQLTVAAIDFLFPSGAASTVTLAFMVMYLVRYPHIQKKIQAEINHVVGRGRFPTLDDRQHLPYTEATLRETMRKETIVPNSLPHVAMEDTTFKGYDIPKGTVVFTSLYHAHMDPKVWGDPENFRPERFLDENGRILKKDLSLPFGAGKRLCAGETFARQNMFLFIAGVLQHFTFLEPENQPLPDISDQFDGFIVSPKDFWVKIVARD